MRCKMMNMTQASMSRNVAALSPWHRHGKKGHELLLAQEDPEERRRKIIRLTPKGEKFMLRLVAKMNKRTIAMRAKNERKAAG